MSSSSSPNPKRPNHPRASAKSTPFSNAASINGNASREARPTTRSHQQRSAMTTSLRKAKRGHTVARKRHMKLPNSTYSFPALGSAVPPPQTQTQQNNPYTKDIRHVKETIEVATSIVNILCSPNGRGLSFSPSPMNGESSALLLSLLDRICVLLTPDESDDIMSSSGTKLSCSSNNRGLSAAGASYDSSMAAIAANSLLSQFVEGIPTHTQKIQPSQTNNLAILLADALALILNTKIGSTPTTHQPMQIKAAIALNQLAATEPPPPLDYSFDQEQFSPYGHPQNMSPSTTTASTPTSWCHALVHSNALSALVQQLPSPTSAINAGEIELCEKCVCVIGNLAGDSEMAREALERMVALPRLIRCLSWGISVQQHNTNNQSLIDLMRNSVWALTNLYQGIGAWEFLDGHIPGIRLTLREVATLLSAPDMFPPSPAIVSRVDTSKTTWNDVAIETCWLVSFLTRDSWAVNFLCGENGQDGKSNVISVLVSRLVQAADAASQQFHAASNNSVQDMGCLIPCCRALRNIANASENVPSILLAKTDNNADCDMRPAELSLAKLISLGTRGGGNEASTIASEAAATAGWLLDDAGLPLPHPATLACRTLLPALCQALVCPLITFEFRREVACALWRAVDFPPEIHLTQGIDTRVDAEVIQKDMLTEAIRTSPNEIARALTAMLSTSDSDALEASLCLIDLLLRRLDTAIQPPKAMSIMFEEVGLVDALWRICDHDSEESANAELAANILDDFYEQEEEDDVEESLEPTSSGGQFQFKMPSVESIPKGGFSFGATAPLQQGQHIPPPMGRGRGRGQVIPAWMQRQQNM